MLLTFEQISKSYGASIVLSDVSAKIEDGDKLGLVGVNGAGKSTLLNIIYGELEPDGGHVSRGCESIGFLRQNSGLSDTGTILSEMTSVFEPLLKIGSELKELGEKIAKTSPEAPEYAERSARYAYLQGVFEQREGYHINIRINTVLNGMGFLNKGRETPVSALSGGEKTRLAICKLLLEEPDLLILDEPTNHLDFKTLAWLEDYLKSYKHAILAVSHDRYFLDKICSGIWDLESHSLTVYKGGYSSYVTQKDERLARLLKEYEIQQAEIAAAKDFIARNLVRASTTARAQSRRKALEKMELAKKPKPPPEPARIRFRYRREPVKDVLHIEGMSLTVGEKPSEKLLFSDLSFDLVRGEKIALIGANGIGKTSFLKAVMGLIKINAGFVEWGKNTDLSYFEQEDFALNSNETALEELWGRFPSEHEHRIRTILGGVGLTGENVYKKIGELSGGERAKLKFAILMISCGNVLLMDEPTNHLDLASKESLDKALCEYTGTLLVVTHDRYLLNKFPSTIAEMGPNGFKLYKGNYDAYLTQKMLDAPGDKTAPQDKPEKTNEYYRSKKQRGREQAEKRRAASLEGEIERLENEIAMLEKEISIPEISSDYILLKEKCDMAEEKRMELELRLSEWAQIERIGENL